MVLLLTIFVAAALAYFTTVGSGNSSASVSSLSTPSSIAASTSGTNIHVTWNAATINGSVAATSYDVERYTSGGVDLGAASCSPVLSSSGSPNAFGSFNCTDSPLAGAGYEYKITAKHNTSWTASTGFTNTAIVMASPSATAAAPATDATNTAITTSSISSVLASAASTASGTITIKVFGPQASAPATCTSGGTTVGTATVSGNGTYHPSAGFTPTTTGNYWWYASYNGDTYDNGATSTCGAGMAETVVTNTTATTATASASDAAGTAIATSSISSALSGATAGAIGTVTFTVFGPQASAPTTCTSGGATVGTAPVSGNGTFHPSAGLTPSIVGNYWWYASYGGDANNSASSSPCGSGMAETVVSKASPAVTAAAPATDTAGATIATSSISSVLSAASGANASGTITFTVFGPQATAPSTCTSGGTTVGTATVSGNGTYAPGAGFTPSAAGNYWWYVSYNGDANNNAATSTCGGAMAETVVSKANAAVTAAAAATDTAGATIATSSISSVLSAASGANASGTITFKVFGPQATAPATCTSGGTTVGTATVSGNGTYNPSASFTPTTVGNYWWYVSYNGDANNNAATSTCGGAMAETVVSKANASVTAAAPATDNAQTAIATTSISSVLSSASGANASGTITFKVFGPQATAPSTCTSGGTAVGTATVSGSGAYNPSAPYTPTRAGTYWWYVSYNGDGNNNAATSTCGSGMASTVVSMVESSVASATSTASGSAATTSSFTIKANTTYLLLVSRNPGASGDSISSLSTTGFSTALTLASFTSINSQTYGVNRYQWAYYVTTSGTESGTGTISLNFADTQSSGNATIVDVVQIQGNNTASPIVTASEGKTNGNSATATANLTAAPSAAANGEIVLLSSGGSLGGSAPTTGGLTNAYYFGSTGGSAGIYTGIPAQQTSSFTITGQRWGTITLEISS